MSKTIDDKLARFINNQEDVKSLRNRIKRLQSKVRQTETRLAELKANKEKFAEFEHSIIPRERQLYRDIEVEIVIRESDLVNAKAVLWLTENDLANLIALYRAQAAVPETKKLAERVFGEEMEK